MSQTEEKLNGAATAEPVVTTELVNVEWIKLKVCFAAWTLDAEGSPAAVNIAVGHFYEFCSKLQAMHNGHVETLAQLQAAASTPTKGSH